METEKGEAEKSVSCNRAVDNGLVEESLPARLLDRMMKRH